jgi:spore coat protein H
MRERLAFALWLALALSLGAAGSQKADPAAVLFKQESVRRLHIEVPPATVAALRQGGKTYVRATIKDGEKTWHDVGLRLKGHGTFQPIDKKPALALKFNEFAANQDFYGLSKVALNNCATDPSFLREVLATQVYRDAGIPAPRATHVRVTLNGRDLGPYVLVEGVNKSFLKRELGHGGGNLYEGETRDIDQKLDLENGEESGQQELKALVAAAKSPLGSRLERMQAVIDVDQFASFLALEMLTAGIDGYTFNRNNYRVYHHPKTERLVFLPHGLDATFGSAGFKPPTNSIVVRALWEVPAFRSRYQQRLGELAERVWNEKALVSQVHALAKRLTNGVSDEAFVQQMARETKTLCYQISQQASFINAEISSRSRD